MKQPLNKNYLLTRKRVDTYYSLWIAFQKQFKRWCEAIPPLLNWCFIGHFITTVKTPACRVIRHFCTPAIMFKYSVLEWSFQGELASATHILVELVRRSSYYYVGMSLEAAAKWFMSFGKMCSFINCWAITLKCGLLLYWLNVLCVSVRVCSCGCCVYLLSSKKDNSKTDDDASQSNLQGWE